MVWGWSLTIDVQPEALVQGKHITIGDVAEVSGDTPDSVARVRSIVIGQAPPVGETRSLHGEYILTRLKQHGFSPEEMQLQVPAKVQVTRAAQRLAAQDVEAMVVRAITARMPWAPQQVVIREVRGIGSVVLPPGPVQYNVTFQPHEDFLGLTSFALSLRVAGHAAERLTGTAYIEVSQEVVTTVRPIARHEVIAPGDVRLTRVPLERATQRMITNAEEVIGKRARRPLQANAAIRPSEVEGAPLVRKGDVVLILVDSPLLKITAMGEALEQGVHGETIRVRNVTSSREIRAVVVDQKTVRVPF
jgi:flagella basal body P-ring formation protein FlgA